MALSHLRGAWAARPETIYGAVQRPVIPLCTSFPDLYGMAVEQCKDLYRMEFQICVASFCNDNSKPSDQGESFMEKGVDGDDWKEGASRKAAALTTVMNHFGLDERRLLASVSLFMPEAAVYVACTSNMVEPLRRAFPQLELRPLPILDEYRGMGRKRLHERGLWVRFMMKKINLMELALDEGHDGAWSMEGDTFLLAPLPVVSAAVALSRHRIRPAAGAGFGEWNDGYSFFRSREALRTWKRASEALGQQSFLQQGALREVAQRHATEMAELGCGVDVGVSRMDPRLNLDREPLYDRIHCANGSVMFQDCAIISGHWHVADTRGLAARPFMERALRECRHPLLKSWLESYAT